MLVQWLGVHATNAGGEGLVPGWELRFRMPGGMARKEKKKKKLKLTYRNSLIKTKENSYGEKKDLNTEDSALSSPSPPIISLTKRQYSTQ